MVCWKRETRKHSLKGVRERKNHNLEHKRSTIAFSLYLAMAYDNYSCIGGEGWYWVGTL